tara:strand:- start:770 stop:1051 length:282 start_codon:yes stop_codon:yes gene_type:complete
MKNKLVLIGAIFLISSSQLLAASDPIQKFLSSLNSWVFLTAGPLLIPVAFGVSALVRTVNEDKGKMIFKNGLTAGITITFFTQLWYWFVGLGA